MRSNPTYDEFKKAFPKKVNGAGSGPEVLSQERVAAEYLTGSDEWNVFLQQVEAERLRNSRILVNLECQILSADMVNHDKLMELKIMANYHVGIIQGLMTAITIPKNVLES